MHQFAADYLELPAADATGGRSFIFQGEPQVPVTAARENATGQFWQSARGDNIDATLTRELDLSGVQQATLTFRTWFDIERNFDFAYVMASRDGGRTWSTLAGREAKIDDPLGVGFGPAYSGRSGGGNDSAGGWRRQGFLRLAEPLAQRFELRLVTFGSPPLVREIAVDNSNRATVPMAGLGDDFQSAVLVIVGATEGTTEVAPYRYEIIQGG